MEKRKFFNKKDIVIIALIILSGTALMCFMPKEEGSRALVIYNGREIDSLPLDRDCIYRPEVNENIEIEVKDGRVRFLSSDCPDKICVNTGWLGKAGQSAVCLPNRLSVTVSGGKDGIEGEI